MKKFLALFLVMMMALTCALVACKKDTDNSEDADDDNDDVVIGYQTTTSNTTADPNNNDAPVNLTWVDAAGDIYVVTGSLNVRNATNYDKTSVVGTVKFADKLTRVRYNDLWTEITYGGVTCYVATKYVTADAGEVTFTDVEDVTVYVNVENTMYLRSHPYYNEGDDSNILTSVKRGAALTKTEVSTNGKWIKVTYTYTPAATAENANPQPVTLTGYCRPGNVSTTQPGEAGAATTTQAPTPQG